jgi:hypothetical protein
MNAIVENLIISLIASLATGVIIEIVIKQIANRLWKIIIIFTSFILPLLILQFYVNIPIELRVTGVNGAPPAKIAKADIGYKNRITGYVKDWLGNKWTGQVYVVVKPLNSASWRIQPPAPANPVGDGWDWEGQAYLGTAAEGAGDRFAVFAIATSKHYAPQETLGSEPSGQKSNVVVLTRTRND